MAGSLRKWWRSFDAFGRKFMSHANPILGTPSNERKMLEQAERQKKAKGRHSNG